MSGATDPIKPPNPSLYSCKPVFAKVRTNPQNIILKSYYFKWRFYDTDFISDILLIKDEKAAIPEDMGLTIYLYYLNNFPIYVFLNNSGYLHIHLTFYQKYIYTL